MKRTFHLLGSQMRATGAHFVLTATLAAVLGTLVGVGAIGAAAPSGSGSCSYAPVHNTVRLLATQQAVVQAGAALNGTAGSVIFEQVPSSHPSGAGFEDVDYVRLVGPDGVEKGPWFFGFDVLFPRVPLCHTGVWKLVDHDTGDVLSRFRTTMDSGRGGPGTVVLDQPLPGRAEWSFDAGSIRGLSPDVAEDTTPQRPFRVEPAVTEVAVDWRTNLTEFSTSRVFAVLQMGGEDGSVVTTRELPLVGEGRLEVYPTWASPGSYQVAIETWEVVEGYPNDWSSRAQERRQLFVTPERGPDPPPVSATLPGGPSAGLADS